MNVTIRPVNAAEHKLAIDLWLDVFGVEPEYFTRYCAGDPWYRPGDTLGAWVDDTLVSTVHLCRRPMKWKGRVITMAGIANVATRPEYRGKCLAASLLKTLEEKLQADDCDYAMLGTGIPEFYERLGWERLALAQFQTTLDRTVPKASGVCEEVGHMHSVLPLYELSARPLLPVRTEEYMLGWVSYERNKLDSYTWVIPECGYIMVRLPGEIGRTAEVSEWSAVDSDTEELLFRQALAAAQTHGAANICFGAMPQFINPAFIGSLAGIVTYDPEPGAMIKNIRLPDDDYTAIKAALNSGQAPCWVADHY